MKQETTGSPRRGWLIAAAATVLTVAAGVTAGGLFGWVGPRPSPGPTASLTTPPQVDPAPAGAREPSVDPTPPAALAGQDATPDLVADEPAGERAEHERREHEGREHHGRREREREHEHDEREGDDDD